MRLSFYYHIPITIKNKKLYVPGFLGVFLDALAKELEHLYLVMHEINSDVENSANYNLNSNNITFVSLGEKTPAWHRAIFHKKILKNKLKMVEHCDAFIVRSPSPLAPYFYKYLKISKVVFMIVGDYSETIKQSFPTTFRGKIVNQYLKYNNHLFEKAIKKVDILVNSPALKRKYKGKSKSIHLIKTTTLFINDFYFREDTCQNDTIELLYTGRIDLLKGLMELVNATAELINKNYIINLHIVGWEEDDQKKPVEWKLLKEAKRLNIQKNIIFHGKKTIGEDLNKMYQMADLYVIPSYQEGFPRTIWEAMANYLPVIATKVGGIPAYLTDKKNVLLIEPRNIEQIVDAIEKIINNKKLRQNIIKYGAEIAKDATLEYQSKKIINIVQKLKNE